MASFQGFYRIENKFHGFVGLDSMPKPGEDLAPVVKVGNIFKHGIFSILLAPDKVTYHISLVGIAQGYLPMQYYTEDVREKLFARRPGGFDPQSWFIVQNTTDDSYMIVRSDNHAHWELSSSKPGTQVEVEGGHHSHDIIKIIEGVIKDKVPLSKEHVAKINQNAFWKLSKVTDMGGKPLKSGPYAIQNAENGPITRGLAAPESNAPVVSSSVPAYWGINRIGGYEYEVTFLGDSASAQGNARPANELKHKLFLMQNSARPERWLIHPLIIPNVYMVFSLLSRNPGGHWQLESSEPDTQVTVDHEHPVFTPFKDRVKKLLSEGALETEAGNSLLAQVVASFDADSELPDNDCFWVIVPASA